MKPTIARFAALGLFLVCLPSCRPREAAKRPLEGTEPRENGHRLPGTGIELITAPGRPTLQLVRRAGDPSGALALAVFPPGGSAGVLQMASLIKTRLESETGPLHLQAHGIGFLLVKEASKPSEAETWARAVRKALKNPVTDDDVAHVKRLPLLQSAHSRADSLSPFGLCMGELAAEGKPALDEAVQNLGSKSYRQFLEQLRVETAVATRVGLSALGEDNLLDAAVKAHAGRWDEGEPLDDSFSGEAESAVVSSRGAREIRVALRVTDGEAALAAARTLRSAHHSIHARLHALDPRLLASDVRVTLRPAGACVGLSVAFDGAADLPLPRVAAVAVLAQQELSAAVSQDLGEDEQNLAVLSPQDAREAAALAAWTAVTSARTGGRPQQILEYRSTETPTVTHQALSRALEEVRRDYSERTLPFSSRDETGQPEVWAMLASPCGTHPESADDAGLRALTMATIARDFDGSRGATLEAWSSPTGMGLIAHGSALRGETVAQHAERIARALGSALSGRALDGRVFAASRADQLDRVGSDPGEEIMKNILGAGQPSLATPRGTGKTVSTFSVADAERTRADLVQEPLRFAMLTNSGKAQAKAAVSALQRWLAPARDQVTPCPKAPTEVIRPGTWEIETIDEEIKLGSFVGVYAPASPAVGHATAFLLNRSGGYLDRAFSDPGLVAHTRAHFVGGTQYGGLYIRISAEPEHLGPATSQARAVLVALSSQNVPSEDLADALARYHEFESETERTQRGRLVRLFQTSRRDIPPPKAPTAASLRAFHGLLGANEHRVVTVRRRK